VNGQVRAVHHVQLACPPGSEARLRPFYTQGLGLAEVAKPAELAGRGGCWFRGAVELHLGVEPDFRPARKAHPGLLVDDLDAVAARLGALGHPVRWDDALLPAYRRCYVDDPVGNRIELLATPGGVTVPG
jgi:catechol 2,3-dioxygenase-like lactoylglutathione lyase family enzyme